jgi:hypothetical protein
MCVKSTTLSNYLHCVKLIKSTDARERYLNHMVDHTVLLYRIRKLQLL